MVNLLKSLLKNFCHPLSKKQSDTHDVIQEENIKDICKISFYMDKDGNIEVLLDWPENMEDIKHWASNYSALISVINCGGFKGDIVKILLDLKDDDSSDLLSKKFISQTLSRLSEAERITAFNSDKPIINPRKAFLYPK
jgi:hypothetical protein